MPAMPSSTHVRCTLCGIVLAGWSSGSTYPLLGGLRSTAQVISYEIAMGLSLVAIFLYSGSMSTSQIVAAQSTMIALREATSPHIIAANTARPTLPIAAPAAFNSPAGACPPPSSL